MNSEVRGHVPRHGGMWWREVAEALLLVAVAQDRCGALKIVFNVSVFSASAGVIPEHYTDGLSVAMSKNLLTRREIVLNICFISVLSIPVIGAAIDGLRYSGKNNAIFALFSVVALAVVCGGALQVWSSMFGDARGRLLQGCMCTAERSIYPGDYRILARWTFFNVIGNTNG